jgi:hypothetical protein
MPDVPQHLAVGVDRDRRARMLRELRVEVVVAGICGPVAADALAGREAIEPQRAARVAM